MDFIALHPLNILSKQQTPLTLKFEISIEINDSQLQNI